MTEILTHAESAVSRALHDARRALCDSSQGVARGSGAITYVIPGRMRSTWPESSPGAREYHLNLDPDLLRDAKLVPG